MKKTIHYAPSHGVFGAGDLSLPETIDHETLVFLAIHGGGWAGMDKSSLAGLAEFLCRNNAVVFNINYRLSSHTPWPACGDDCLNAAGYMMTAEFAGQSGIRPKGIYLIGASAGGHLALWTGLRLPSEQVKGMIAISPIADPYADCKLHPGRYRTLFGQEADDGLLEEINPVRYLKKDSPPILLTHSSFDQVVPVESVRSMDRQAKSCGAEVETFIYDLNADGHSIWIPHRDPHCLYPFLEDKILSFLNKCRLQAERE